MAAESLPFSVSLDLPSGRAAILMGRLMGANPFDQPAVERGRVLARKYLEAGI
jgi:hypothetical protein